MREARDEATQVVKREVSDAVRDMADSHRPSSARRSRRLLSFREYLTHATGAASSLCLCSNQSK